MRLKILKAPNSKLKQKARKVEIFDKNLSDFAKDLIETMGQDAGLASIQVEDDNRFQYPDTVPGFRNQPSIIIVNVNELIVAINPEIIEKSERILEGPEGCLSVDNVFGKVPRYENIKVKYQDLNGNEHIKEFFGMESVCFQHEIDHLNGILYPDRMSPIKSALLWKKHAQASRFR
jgi:peptide deformylase